MTLWLIEQNEGGRRVFFVCGLLKTLGNPNISKLMGFEKVELK